MSEKTVWVSQPLDSRGSELPAKPTAVRRGRKTAGGFDKRRLGSGVERAYEELTK